MIIHTHILTHNEEKLLPFTLDHYSSFSDKIFIHDNMSDDSTDDIVNIYPKAQIHKWESNGQMDELTQVNKRNNDYKKFSRDADWVIVCDCDEFLYHPNILGVLLKYKNEGVTVPKIQGYVMASNVFPKYDGKLITEKIKIGEESDPMGSKNIIFNPKIDMLFGEGSHRFTSNNTIFSNDVELKLLHYRFLSKQYLNNIYKSRSERLSSDTKRRGWNGHYLNPNENLLLMDKIIKNNKTVI
jgi:hypothetical protein